MKTRPISKIVFSFCLIFIVASIALGTELEKNKQIRPKSQLSGTVMGPLEKGKQALSSGDKIIISIPHALNLKKGDFLEIFNLFSSRDFELKDPFFKKIGVAIVLENFKDDLFLCVIDSSTQEVLAGDRVFVAGPK